MQGGTAASELEIIHTRHMVGTFSLWIGRTDSHDFNSLLPKQPNAAALAVVFWSRAGRSRRGFPSRGVGDEQGMNLKRRSAPL